MNDRPYNNLAEKYAYEPINTECERYRAEKDCPFESCPSYPCWGEEETDECEIFRAQKDCPYTYCPAYPCWVNEEGILEEDCEVFYNQKHCPHTSCRHYPCWESN